MRDGYWSVGSAAGAFFHTFFVIHNVDQIFPLSAVATHAWHRWIPSLYNIPLIMRKEANPTFGLYSETRTGSLIIMSLLHSAQGEPSISCHRVWAHGVIFSKVLPIVGADLFITSLCDSTPTHCCTWMYLSDSVITTGVIGLGLMTDNETGIQERRTACHVSTQGHTHNTHAHTHTHGAKTRLY